MSAEPAAPKPAAPKPPAALAAVTAAGDADLVWLEGAAGGRVELGPDVPAGEYRIVAAFKGQAPMPAGRVTVRGAPIVLTCSAAFQVCQAR
ncbi:MAG: hypothetical protein ABMB14_35780 [Myxococcota bacterium]